MCSVPFSPEKVLLWGLDLQFIKKGDPKPLPNQDRKDDMFQTPLRGGIGGWGAARNGSFLSVFEASNSYKTTIFYV